MSQTTSTPHDHAALLAERYGFPVVDGPAAHLIAALHTIINWLIEHPDVPVPQAVELIFHSHEGVAGALDSADLVALADKIDGRVGTGGNSQWVDKPLPTYNGVTARYVAYGLDRRTAQVKR